MPNGHGPGFTNWDCMVCGKADNAGWRTRCRNCSAYPMHGARRPKGAGKGGGGKNNTGGNKGKGKGAGKQGSSAQSANGHSEGNDSDYNFTFAERQLQRQRTHEAQAAQRSSEKLLQDQRRRNEMLQEQNRKLLREVTAARSNRADLDGDDEMEEGPEDLTTDERKARIEKIRASLPYLEEQCGSESAMYRDAVDELELHSRAIREAKPYKTHRTILERKVERLRRLQDRDRERLTELHDAADEIRVKLTTTETAIADRDKELEAAEAELKELVLRAVGEDSGGTATQTSVDPSQGWQSVVSAVAQLTRQPGVPTHVAGQIEGLFNQLRSMVSALETHAAVIGTAAAAAPPAATTAPTATPSRPSTKQQQQQQQQRQQQQQQHNETEQTPPLPPARAEELRRIQTQAWRQRRSTEAINSFIETHRAANAAAARAAALQGDDTAASPGLGSDGKPVAAIGATAGAAATEGAAAGSMASTGAAGCTNGDKANSGGGDGRNGDGAGERSRARSRSRSNDMRGSTLGTNRPAAETPVACQALDIVEVSVNSDMEDALSTITGTISEPEVGDEEMEEVVAQVPAEQRAKVRALLAVRRCRRVRRIQRHKKPEEDGTAARDSKR